MATTATAHRQKEGQTNKNARKMGNLCVQVVGHLAIPAVSYSATPQIQRKHTSGRETDVHRSLLMMSFLFFFRKKGGHDMRE